MDVCLNAAVGKKAKRTVEKNEERKCEKYVCFAMFAAGKYKCFVCRKDGTVLDDGWTKCVGGECSLMVYEHSGQDERWKCLFCVKDV